MKAIFLLGIFLLFGCGNRDQFPIPPAPPNPVPPAPAPGDFECNFDDAKPVSVHLEGFGSTFYNVASPLDPSETVMPTLQDPTLIQGVPADVMQWPSSVYASAGNSSCSSTIIGSRTLLSAGHCMKNGGSVTFSVGANRYTARCTHHPEYKNNSTADWALCFIDRPVTGVIFERLSTKFNIRVGDTVRLTGYGCTSSGGGGGNDGIFRIGTAQVTAVPSSNSYDVVTKGGAALCFGDSGGAAYVESSDGTREIFGVNSRGNIKNTSYLPAVALSTMNAFATEWAQTNGAQICGITPGALACRDEKLPPPPPDPPKPKWDFEIRSKAACIRGKLNKGYEEKKPSIIEALKQALFSF